MANSKIIFNNGPWDGFEMQLSTLDNLYAIDIEFRDCQYTYSAIDGKFTFDDETSEDFKQIKQWEQEMVDCPSCGQPAAKEFMAKSMCQQCIYELIMQGNIIES